MSSSGTRFLVVGDLTLDVSVAPSEPMRPSGDVPASIQLGPGGQGANVAVRLARRGCAVTLLTALADDTAGRLLRQAMEREGIELLARPAAQSSVVIVLLDGSGERTMLSDRQGLDGANLAAQLAAHDWVHVSGYALLDEEAGDDLAEMLGSRASATRLSVGGGSVPADVARAGRFGERLRLAPPDLLVLSASEAVNLGADAGDPAAQAEQLASLASVVVVTAAGRGSAAALAGETLDVPAEEADEAGEAADEVRDSTGAGDAYAAALIAQLAAGAWPPSEAELCAAMRAGSALAAQVIRVPGAQGLVPMEERA